MFELLEELGAERGFLFTDRATGLRAVLVIDSTVLGPAAGGIRTRDYPSVDAAVRDAAALARAMTIKCALGGLDAGGGKMVVLDHRGLDRAGAFARLGDFVDDLGGLFRTAGDLGTTAADLATMAERCRFVHTGEASLAASVARGLVRCIEACARVRGRSLAGLRVAVQGAGAIGAAACAALAAAGATVLVADLDPRRARAAAGAAGAEVADADSILTADVDVVAPCAAGGAIDGAVAGALRAWAVCGAANNLLASPDAEAALAARDILFVPDVVASAGAVIDGIGRTVMGLEDPARADLIDRLGDVAHELLAEARQTGRPASGLAEARAFARIGSR